MPDYDPETAAVTTDATIGGVTYIVTGYTNNGAAPVIVNFQNSDGSYKNCRIVEGPTTGTLTIEVMADVALPEVGDTCSYDGTIWVVEGASKSLSSTGPGSITVSMRKVVAAT